MRKYHEIAKARISFFFPLSSPLKHDILVDFEYCFVCFFVSLMGVPNYRSEKIYIYIDLFKKNI